jgi:carbamoyltransferase
VNLKIKFREGFRPFAPSVLEEDINEYFNSNRPSPYMLFIAFIKSERRNSLPENYWDLPLKEKLYYIRSDIPAITHIDFSARLQTVNRETNYKFWKLLKTFKEITGYSVIINTSFNIRGEPIVCSPEDALKCFLKTEMDYLVIGDFIVDKSKQERIEEKIKIESLVLD